MLAQESRESTSHIHESPLERSIVGKQNTNAYLFEQELRVFLNVTYNRQTKIQFYPFDCKLLIFFD